MEAPRLRQALPLRRPRPLRRALPRRRPRTEVWTDDTPQTHGADTRGRHGTCSMSSSSRFLPVSGTCGPTPSASLRWGGGGGSPVPAPACAGTRMRRVLHASRVNSSMQAPKGRTRGRARGFAEARFHWHFQLRAHKAAAYGTGSCVRVKQLCAGQEAVCVSCLVSCPLPPPPIWVARITTT